MTLIDARKASTKKKLKKFYLTTPIYYINDLPHVGHAYTTIIADILARFFRQNGFDTFFLTGTDENSQKNVEAALQSGEKNIKKYVDKMANEWKKRWKALGFSFDYFIRTTEKNHKIAVRKFFLEVFKKGDIYKGKYEGYYCKGCEAFVAKSDLVNGKCSLHLTEPIWLSEENYFFKASKYKEKLLKHIEKNPQFILPEARRNEVIEYIKTAFGDTSISRQKIKWGIPVPIDKSQVVYVWFDALINYLSGIGYGWNEKFFKKYWPADLHLIGKDITKFHCALWPAMLLSAGIKLPKTIFAHGFFTVNSQKISKSLGNIIDPIEISKKYSTDALRYFLIREVSFGEDGDFSEKKLIEKLNGELIGNFGNFIHRTLTFIYKSFNAKIPAPNAYDRADKEFLKKLRKLAENVKNLIEKYRLTQALIEILNFSSYCNQYFQNKRPWETNDKNCLFLSANAAKALAIVCYPFLPNTSEKIWKILNLKSKVSKQNWKNAHQLNLKPGHKIRKPEILFRKVEV